MSLLNKKSKDQHKTMPSNSINVIGKGTLINGDITSDGDIRLDGTIQGTLITKAKLVLGITGKVDGQIQAQNADLSGKVDGNVQVAEILHLKSTAIINGDIRTGKLVVESGGQFNGKCTMGGAQPSANTHTFKSQVSKK